jgi:hypothetical protein
MIKSEFINGNHFAEVCDFVIDSDHKFIDNRIADKNCVIFCKTDWIVPLFNYLRQILNRKYIVVIGMSDYNYTDNINNIKPANVIKVFTTMNRINHLDIISIPVGVENFYGASKGGSIDVEKLEEESNNIIVNKRQIYFLNKNYNSKIT